MNSKLIKQQKSINTRNNYNYYSVRSRGSLLDLIFMERKGPFSFSNSHTSVNIGSSTDLRNKIIRKAKRNMLTAPSEVHITCESCF